MAERVSYPRINCCIKGCKRGTTTVEPGTRIICGKCWRKAPKWMRDCASHWRQRARMFDRRGDSELAAAYGCSANNSFENIRKVLNGKEAEGEGLPPLMGEELRKAGLI